MSLESYPLGHIFKKHNFPSGKSKQKGGQIQTKSGDLNMWKHFQAVTPQSEKYSEASLLRLIWVNLHRCQDIVAVVKLLNFTWFL